MTPEFIRAESVRAGDVLDVCGARVNVAAVGFGCCQRSEAFAKDAPLPDCGWCAREPVWIYADDGRTFARVTSDLVQITARAGA